MDFEIIIRNATLTEAKELFAAIPARIPIKVTRTDLTGPQPKEVPVETVHAKVVEKRISKWGIPFSWKESKKKYQNAWNLCKKWNLPYPEAILKTDPIPVTIQKTKPTPLVKPAPVTMDTTPKSENIEGWKVKQIKADRGKQIPGTLTVIARRNGSGLIECMYEKTRHVIDAACLERVIEKV